MKKKLVVSFLTGMLFFAMTMSVLGDTEVNQQGGRIRVSSECGSSEGQTEKSAEGLTPEEKETAPTENVVSQETIEINPTSNTTLEQKVIDGEKYMVYSDGKNFTGWYDMSPTWRLYFNPDQDGAAVTGKTEIQGKTYIFNGDGILYRGSGTPQIDGKKYWMNQDGTLNSGWLNLGNWKMYFDEETCEARIGLTLVEKKRYIFDDNGVMQGYAGTPIINGKKYWFSEDGSLRTGWLNLGNWKMYFDEETCEARIGLTSVGEKRYIFDNNGVMQVYAGTPVINGKKYWFSEDGSLRTGWLNLGNWKMYFEEETCEARIGLSYVEGKRYLFDNNGVLIAQPGTPVINGKKYWFASDGSLNTGWLVLGNWKMYFDEETCEGAVGLANIEEKKYVFDQNGIQLTGIGTQVVNGKKYCFNPDGSVETGWVKISAWTFYFDKNTGAAATGVQNIDGKRYAFDSNGVWLTGSGTVVINGNKYCFNSDGTVVLGWVTLGSMKLYFNPDTGIAATGMTVIGGKTYYFDNNGVLGTGTQFLNGKQYYFGSNGEMLRNTWVKINGEKIYVDGSGVGLTDLSYQYPGPYKLVVDRTNNVVTAYAKDSAGRYTIPVRSMLCSVGLPSTATPAGTFYTSAKYTLKELMGPSWGKYATRVVGGVLFHSVATGSPSDPTHTVPAGEYNKLGSPASHGCIRLCVRDAKWIYDHCSLGTQVQIGDNFSMPFGKPTLPKISGSVDPTDPVV
ncbi:L,D-transpeptidase family protein [Novisyntrophococcus fermenticellae]|uniref:L,D-transpeptidase family protein n=1 Tax=Novisyntrophococcus fermenticellae TaxID=2068655 RepID=UPI001E479BED|nr:L,D-transpeptidase family protein [Novisyntrophococcus fermenticellae]